MVTGPDHFRESERLIRKAQKLELELCVPVLAQAQVHATLALTAATAYPAIRDYWGDEDTVVSREWVMAVAP